MFALISVTILSVLSIILQSVNLMDYHPDDTYSIVAIVSTALMFVLPWSRRFLRGVGDWLFIITSLVSLISQAMAFGKYAKTDAHDILLISTVASVLGAFVGHFIKTKKDEVYHGSPLINKFKMLFIVASLIVYLLDSKMDPKPIAFDIMLVLTIICIPIYLFITFVLITLKPEEIKSGYVKLMDNEMPLKEFFHRRRKPLTLLVSAIPLTTYSIFVGEMTSTVNIVTLGLFLMALVLEHVNALYFK